MSEPVLPAHRPPEPAQLGATVHTFLFDRAKTRVWLLLRANTGSFDGHWGLPAGRLDAGESARAGACREAAEEAGIAVRPDDLKGPYVLHDIDARGQRVRFYFSCDAWEGEPQNAEPHKCAGTGWFPVGTLPENVVPAVRSALAAVLEGKAFGEAGFPPIDA